MKSLLCLASILFLPTTLLAVEAPLDVTQSSLKFTGHAFMHNFSGEAKQFSGSAEVDPNKPAVESARIKIKAARMTTFEGERDHDMLAWLHVDVNPDLSFRLTRVTLVSGDSAHATKDHPAHFRVDGIFTLNHVSKPLEAQAEGWREGDLLVVAGKTKVDTASHGLPIIKKYFMTVGKDVDIDFHLAFDLPKGLQWPAVQ